MSEMKFEISSLIERTIIFNPTGYSWQLSIGSSLARYLVMVLDFGSVKCLTDNFCTATQKY